MLNHPLQLAVGSHKAGSGRGCAMNVISWEQGDKVITDYPDCASPLLAMLVQIVNDQICTHTTTLRDEDGMPAYDDEGEETRLLCPDCSMKMIGLAHRTVGTRVEHASPAGLEFSRYAALHSMKLAILKTEANIARNDALDQDADPREEYYHSHGSSLRNRKALLERCLEAIEEHYGVPGCASFTGDDTVNSEVGMMIRTSDRTSPEWDLNSECGYLQYTIRMGLDQDDEFTAVSYYLDAFDRITGTTAPLTPPEVIETAYQKMTTVA